MPGVLAQAPASTHKLLVVVIGEEHLQPRGPVFPPPQQPVGALVPTHVAVPRVFFNGRLGSAGPHQEIHALHAEAPGRKPRAAVGPRPRPVPGAAGEAGQGGASPAAVVVPAHEHLAPPAADGAVGLVAVVVILVGALQEAVLGSGWQSDPARAPATPAQPCRRHPAPRPTRVWPEPQARGRGPRVSRARSGQQPGGLGEGWGGSGDLCPGSSPGPEGEAARPPAHQFLLPLH